ncbi:hypothetical protein NFI96_000789 [Prochilodus magdalenae]|nr:hypothetical protein NFI96_000789 [Prochilodus magdalenae]
MVNQVVLWSTKNNLELNTAKTVKITVGFRRSSLALPALTILDRTVMAMESVMAMEFLGTTFTMNLKWDCNISSIIKKAQQRMYFLRQLRKFNLSQELMVQFYTATRTRKRVEKIVTDPSHTGHHQFQHLPPGRRFSQMRIKTNQATEKLLPTCHHTHNQLNITIHIQSTFGTLFSLPVLLYCTFNLSYLSVHKKHHTSLHPLH